MRRRASVRACQLATMRDVLPNCCCQRKTYSCPCNQLFCRADCTPARNSDDSFSSGDINDIQPANANANPSRRAWMPSNTTSVCIDLTRIRPNNCAFKDVNFESNPPARLGAKGKSGATKPVLLPDALGGQDENNCSIRFTSAQRARRMSEAIDALRQQTSKTKAILRRCPSKTAI